MGTDMAENDL